MTAVVERPRAQSRSTAAVRDQAVVASGQIAAGLGNMVFSLVMARILAPGAFAQFASFLALYLLLSMPGSAVSAMAALEPTRVARFRPMLLFGGAAVGVALAAASPWLGPALRLPVAMVVVLGLSAPALGTLALDRGRLYGWNRHARLVASLVVEPAVRLLFGLALATAGGAVGGALGVTVAGYAALEIARRHWSGKPASAGDGAGTDAFDMDTRQFDIDELDTDEFDLPATTEPATTEPATTEPATTEPATTEPATTEPATTEPATTEPATTEPVRPARPARPALPRAATWTVFAFLAVVVVQNQDLLIANRVLSPGQAGQFAVLSILGGLSVFATMTVPLVLLPRSRAGEGGLAPALAITGLIGGAAVGVVALAPAPLITALFGARYRQVAGVLVLYVGAMSLLGIARVLVAHRCATEAGKSSLVLSAMAVAAQAALIISFGHDPRSVALSTTTAVSGLTASLGVAEALRWQRLRQRWSRIIAALTRPVTLALIGISVSGLVVRLIVPRGLWLDEATSVDQARMSFAGMISNLRTTDVHPPLYFSVLWVAVRWFGSGELAVRLPSIVAGALVVPMLYVLGKEAYDRRTGVVAAAVGSVAPIMVWYSQEARMYAFLMLFGVIALWAQVRILKRGGRWSWVIFAVASIALVWTQYFGGLQVAVQQLAFLTIIGSRYRRGRPVRGLVIGWAVTLVAIVIWVAPLVPFAYQQFMVNQTAGKGFGGPQQVGNATSLSGNHLSIYAAIANLIWAVWGYHSNAAMALLAALWPLGMLFALVLLGRRRQRVTTLFVAAVLVPGVVMFALGSVKRDLFDIRYLSTAVPVLFVLIARMVTGVSRRMAVVVVGTSLVVASLLVGLVDQQYNGTNPRTYDFRQALQPVEARARPGDVIIYDPADLREVVQYYAPRPVLEPIGALPNLATSGHAVFVLASPSLMNGPSDTAALSKALTSLRAHDRLVMHRNLPNVEIWEFH